MIYAVASDHAKTTVVSDGAITGVATLGDGDVWNTKTGIAVALLRMYLAWQPNSKLHDMSCYNHYYVINVNMAMFTELVARACKRYGQEGRYCGEIALYYSKAVPIKIMSYHHSFDGMLDDIKKITRHNGDFFISR